jgi:hypothetical protein
MGDYQGGRMLDEEEVEENLSTFRWVNLIFHAVRLLVSLAAFGVCLWIR